MINNIINFKRPLKTSKLGKELLEEYKNSYSLTVGDLIKFLSQYPDNTELVISMDGVDEPDCDDPLCPASNVLPIEQYYNEFEKHLEIDFEVTIST